MPASHDCDSIGDCHHFIEFVCDDNEAFPFTFEVTHTIKKSFDLLWGKHGCRLIHDEDVCTVVEDFQDFRVLLCPNRQGFDRRVQWHIETELRGESGNLLTCLLVIEECSKFARFFGKDDVLESREDRNKRKVLLHHSETELHRAPW